jgi:hypothetical protein
MANSKLKGTQFVIPKKLYLTLSNILKKYSDMVGSAGYKRLNGLINNGQCSYEQMKRIKNYFDHYDPNNDDDVQYELNGGQAMRNWINFTLDQARKSVENTKIHNTNAGLTNQFNQAPEQNLVNAAMPPKIRKYPDILTNSPLMEQINKIKQLINKLD